MNKVYNTAHIAFIVLMFILPPTLLIYGAYKVILQYHIIGLTAFYVNFQNLAIMLFCSLIAYRLPNDDRVMSYKMLALFTLMLFAFLI